MKLNNMKADEPELNNNDKARNEIIAKLPLSKQFILRQHLKNVDLLSKEQAIEMLKECMVNSAYKDITYLAMLNPKNN